MVEKILEDRGEHDAKEYLVRWAGWTSEYDAWRSADDVSDDLVVAYQAERDRQRLAAEKAERDERALYAAEAIALLQARLAAKLMKQRKSAAATTILRLDLCEEWKLRAIHEYLETRVPDGDVFSGHLTAIKRTVGASGRSKFVDARSGWSTTKWTGSPPLRSALNPLGPRPPRPPSAHPKGAPCSLPYPHLPPVTTPAWLPTAPAPDQSTPAPPPPQSPAAAGVRPPATARAAAPETPCAGCPLPPPLTPHLRCSPRAPAPSHRPQLGRAAWSPCGQRVLREGRRASPR